MKKTITLVSAALMTALCSLSVKADKVYYVDPDGNAPEGITVDAVYTKIGTAINNVTADEPVTIYLKPDHTFNESNLTTDNKRVDLTIIGMNTTINANAAQRILRTEAARLELKGIAFTGVKSYTSMGGALYFAGNANSESELLIDSCVFENISLSSGADGGAAIATGSNAMNVTITNCVFNNNHTEGYRESMSGTAIHFQGKSGKFVVENSVFQNSDINSNNGALAVGIVTGSNVQARLVNNTFYNNTTKGVPTGSVPNILIKGTSNTVAVVNNTFYFDLREETDETESEADMMKDVYRRTSAVNISETGNNTLHFVNNVVVGMRSAVISPAKTGRTIVCQNNYNVVLEPHGFVPELADGENGNVLLTGREANTGDPVVADIDSLTALIPSAGLDAELSADNFVPYLAMEKTSPLVNAGVNEYMLGEENMVPEFDVAGNPREDGYVDIGAYEYVDDDPSTGIADNAWSEKLAVYVQAGDLVIENHADEAFEVSLVQIDGRQVAALSVQQTAVISRGTLPHGVLLVVATDGTSRIIKKVIL